MMEIVLGVMALVFCFIGTLALAEISQGYSSAGTRSMAAWCFVLMLFCMIFALSGCQTAKTIIDTCKDGLCR